MSKTSNLVCYVNSTNMIEQSKTLRAYETDSNSISVTKIDTMYTSKHKSIKIIWFVWFRSPIYRLLKIFHRNEFPRSDFEKKKEDKTCEKSKKKKGKKWQEQRQKNKQHVSINLCHKSSWFTAKPLDWLLFFFN